MPHRIKLEKISSRHPKHSTWTQKRKHKNKTHRRYKSSDCFIKTFFLPWHENMCVFIQTGRNDGAKTPRINNSNGREGGKGWPTSHRPHFINKFLAPFLFFFPLFLPLSTFQFDFRLVWPAVLQMRHASCSCPKAAENGSFLYMWREKVRRAHQSRKIRRTRQKANKSGVMSETNSCWMRGESQSQHGSRQTKRER